jgi:phosphate transport system permease protein
MTDATHMTSPAPKSGSLLVVDAHTRRRNASEARFRLAGRIAVALGVLALVGLLASILSNGVSSFRQTFITLDVYLDPAKLDKSGERDLEKIAKVSTFGYNPLINNAMDAVMEANGITIDGISGKKAGALISKEAPATIRDFVLANPDRIGETVTFRLLASGRIDGYYKGRVTMDSAARDRNTSPEELRLADALKDAGVLDVSFNWGFFTAPDASDTRPEAAGLGVAILG